jgi:hypothetical protein
MQLELAWANVQQQYGMKACWWCWLKSQIHNLMAKRQLFFTEKYTQGTLAIILQKN